MQIKYIHRLKTPIGVLRICTHETDTEQYITDIELDKKGIPDLPTTPLLRNASRQLREYFDGTRKAFDLPLGPSGTEFQQKAWQALLTIPYGETRTYGEMAAQIGRPTAARAVGGANHRNPIMLVIPCHRVIGADGSLTGYASGLKVKQFLLDWEGKQLRKANKVKGS